MRIVLWGTLHLAHKAGWKNAKHGDRWAEFDTVGKLWTIPAERMKAKREHQVPLSDAALALLESMPRDSDGDVVFAG